MTWIVGFVSPHGYAGLVSDIRVSWQDGSELDAIRKTHWVGGNLAVAFAGSVKLGFRIVSRFALVRKTARSDDILTDSAWAEALANVGRKVFEDAKEKPEDRADRALGVTLLFASATPRTGDTSIPALYKLASPDFNTVPIGVGEMVSIGSGSKNAALLEVVSAFEKDVVDGLVPDDAQAAVLGQKMLLALNENPQPGISHHFHVVYVERGRILAGNSDMTHLDQQYGERTFKMPPVASTWRDFQRDANANGLNAACAIA